VHNDGARSHVPADADARIRRRPSRTSADGSGCRQTDVLYVDVFEVPSPNGRYTNTFHKTRFVHRSYNTPGQNWLQAMFGTVRKVIICRIIMQVSPLIPASDKMLQTKIR